MWFVGGAWFWIEIANGKEGEHIRIRPKKNKIDKTNFRQVKAEIWKKN